MKKRMVREELCTQLDQLCVSQNLRVIYAEDSDVTDQLMQVAQEKPEKVLLVSHIAVYGKCYGEPKKRSEGELGYACHTSAEDAVAWKMRQGEHFAHRIAVEEGLSILIVRVDDQTEIDQITKVLEKGIPGELYNLPGMVLARQQAASPLRPVPVAMNGEKAASLY